MTKNFKDRIKAVALFLAVPCLSFAEQALFVSPHGGGVQLIDTKDMQPMGLPGEKGVFQTTEKANRITFNIQFLDVSNNTNVGFDDPVRGPVRRETLLKVFNYINTVLDHPGATVDVQIQQSLTAGTGSLASGGTNYQQTGPFATNFQDGATLFRINTGNKLFSGFPEIFLTVDFGYNWNDDLDPVQPSEFDLFSTALHEITHGLGFVSIVGADGRSRSTGVLTYTRLDELFALPVSPGTPSITGSPLEFRPSDAPLTGGADSIIFSGSSATASFGTNPPIATPPTFFEGTSLGHWQGPIVGFTVPFTEQDGVVAVMNPATPPGVERREFAPFEIEALRDIGFSIKIISGASSWNIYE